MGRSTSGSNRLDTSVSDPATIDKAKRLMSVLDAGNADLFRGALDVLDWCVRQVREGRHVASFDESGDTTHIRELSTPMLDAARRHSQMNIVLHDEAFDQVVQLLDEPPEPTRALGELMEETSARRKPVGA